MGWEGWVHILHLSIGWEVGMEDMEDMEWGEWGEWEEVTVLVEWVDPAR